MIEMGEDINEKGFEGKTPLIEYIEKGNAELVQFCLKNGAVLDSETQAEKALLQLPWQVSSHKIST